MYNPLESVLSRITSGSNRRLKILTVPTHESFQTLLGQLPHDFYMLQGDGIKTWDFVTKPLPPNHFLLQQKFPPFPDGIEFDLVLSQDRFGTLQKFSDLAGKLNLPLVHIDHALPPYGLNQYALANLKTLRAHRHVYVGNKGKEIWGGLPEDPVIYYGMNDQIFKGWHGTSKVGLSVVNQFASRDVFCGWGLWQTVAKQIPIHLVGENPGISESAKSTEHLVQMMGEARFFLNTSQYSTFPMTVAEAMMVGCPVISTSNYEIPLVIKHGVNGFLADNVEDITKYAKLLLEDHELARRISVEGRKTAQKLFNVEHFVKEWNKVLTETYEAFR